MPSRLMRFMCGHRLHGRMNSTSGTSTATFEAWIKPSALTGSYQPILRKWDSNTGQAEYALGIDGATGRLRYDQGTGGSVVATSGTLSVGQWTHVAATFAGGTVVLYVNGVVVGSGGVNPAFNNTPAPFEIGADAGTLLLFNGSIDEVAIFPTSLNSGTINTHYQAGVTADASTYQGVILSNTPRGY